MAIATRNEEWGFYGTMLRNSGEAATPAKAQAAWNKAIAALVEVGMGEEMARDFLDSRYGRHLADEVGIEGDVLPRFKKWIDEFKNSGHAAGFGEV
jgi:hypothetical protein